MILNIWGLRGCFLINNSLPCARPSPFPKLFQAKRRWPLWIRTVLCQLIPVPPLTRSVSLDVQLRATVIVSWLNLSQWSWWIRGCAEHSTIWSSTHVWFSLWETLGEQRKLQTTEPKGIRHATSSDTHPWPQFTSHSKPQLSMAGFHLPVWFQVNLCYSLDLEYPQGGSIEKLWDLWGAGSSERSLGHCEYVLEETSLILGSSELWWVKFSSIMRLNVLYSLTAGLRMMRPTDHGLRPPKVWAKVSFEG